MERNIKRYIWAPSRPRARLFYLLLVILFLGVTFRSRLLQEGTIYLGGWGENLGTQSKQYNPSRWLNGPPALSFRDNLRTENQYITSWTYAGWTNDFMGFGNMIYLALITSRIPILPPFPPSLSHIGKDATYLHYGDIFDLPRLSTDLGIPILEWRDVKQEGSTVTDELGCWSPWATVTNDNRPRHNNLIGHLGLSVSYTTMPLKSFSKGDTHISFWELASATFPTYRNIGIASKSAKTFPSANGTYFPPDEQLACFDVLYYVAAKKPFEWAEDYSPAWRFVGTHIHWSPRIESMVDGYLRRMLQLGHLAPIPPMITLHIRRTDFKNACKLPLEECMAPLAAYVRRVKEVKQELLEKRGLAIDHVVVTSDERDSAWWNEVQSLGWKFIDHDKEETVKKHGKWYPALLEAVIQSKGIGFVGTAGSTMTLVAARRVEDWNDGVAQEVKWGRKDADAH